MSQTVSPQPSPNPAKTPTPPPTPRGGGGSSAAATGGEGGRLSPASETLDLTLYPFSEPLLALALGVPARNLTNARVKKLARGADWELDGGSARLNERALIELTKAVGLALTVAEFELVREKCRVEKLPPAFKARVRRFPANPKLLTVCWREGELDREANIITAKRNNFRIGMEVPIRLDAVSQRYVLASRPPRGPKGRW